MEQIEQSLINKIMTQLKEKRSIRVPFKTFLRLWQPKTDVELTNKLIEFKINNKLDYVIIIDPIHGPQYIRFWLNTKFLLEEGKGYALHKTTEEERNGGSSSVNGEKNGNG